MQLQIGVKVIIQNSDGRYLLIQRTELLQDEQTVSWDIPGGRIDPEEHLSEALTREVREELGIQLSGEPRLLNAQDIFVESKGLHVVRLTYLLTQDIDSIQLSDEHQAYTWATRNELGSLTIEPYLKDTLALIK